MLRYLALVGCLIGLCSCSPLVIATFDNDDEIYRGTASPAVLPRGSGDLSLSNTKGRVCTGTYHYLNADISIRLIPLVGVAALHCSDGVTASMRFRSISNSSGWGTGKTSTGAKVSFTYGLSEDEAKMYLALPETSIDDDKPSTGGGNSDSKPEKVSPEIREISLGTGFFVSKQGHILTNNHVVKGCEYMQVRLPDGTQQRGETLFTDGMNDLAVIKIDYQPSSIATFPVSGTYRVGDDVHAFGFGLAYQLSSSGLFTSGTISALSGFNDDSRFMQISATIQHGNSGGPLTDKMGNVIGINTQIIDTVEFYKRYGATPENASFSVKEDVMKSFLKAHSIPFTEINKTQPMAAADLGEQMRLYSVKASCFGHPKIEKKENKK